MSADTATTPTACTSDTGKLRLLTLDSLDNRTKAARDTRALLATIEGDLGGSRYLSAAQRQIAQRAAVLGAILESQEAGWLAGDGIDLAQYTTAANAQRRLLESVGLKRKHRRVEDARSLDEYIAARGAGHDDD